MAGTIKFSCSCLQTIFILVLSWTCCAQFEICHGWPCTEMNVCCKHHTIWNTKCKAGLDCITRCEYVHQLMLPAPQRMMYNCYCAYPFLPEHSDIGHTITWEYLNRKRLSYIIEWPCFICTNTAGLLSTCCITDKDGARNSISSLGAAQSVPLPLTHSDEDAASHTHSIHIPDTTQTNQLKCNG